MWLGRFPRVFRDRFSQPSGSIDLAFAIVEEREDAKDTQLRVRLVLFARSLTIA